MTFTWLDMLVVPQLVPRVRRRIEKSMVETKTRDHKETPKSWIDVYTEVTALRKHTTLLGQKVETDEWLEWRVKWGQRGAGGASLVSLICHAVGEHIPLIVFGALTLVFIGLLYYKNISFIIARRLLREMNVILIIKYGLCNSGIEIVTTRSFIHANSWIDLYVISILFYL